MKLIRTSIVLWVSVLAIANANTNCPVGKHDCQSSQGLPDYLIPLSDEVEDQCLHQWTLCAPVALEEMGLSINSSDTSRSDNDQMALLLSEPDRVCKSFDLIFQCFEEKKPLCDNNPYIKELRKERNQLKCVTNCSAESNFCLQKAVRDSGFPSITAHTATDSFCKLWRYFRNCVELIDDCQNEPLVIATLKTLKEQKKSLKCAIPDKECFAVKSYCLHRSLRESGLKDTNHVAKANKERFCSFREFFKLCVHNHKECEKNPTVSKTVIVVEEKAKSLKCASTTSVAWLSLVFVALLCTICLK